MADDDDSAQRLHMLQRAILSYLAKHPDAKDTLEGIMHWWLPGGNTSVRLSDVGSALDALVARGWMNAPSRDQGVRVYSLNQARQNEIREWLEN